MAKSIIAQVKRDAERLFSNKQTLDSFNQEVALHFWPEMSEFTDRRYLGEEFADHLTTSYPILARRQLGNSIGSILRPPSLESNSPGVWFSMRAKNEDKEDGPAREWLDRATRIMRRAMYDVQSGFVKAARITDHQFATFGNAPLSMLLNEDQDVLTFKAWHLHDVVWTEDAYGDVGAVYRRAHGNRKITLMEAVSLYKDKCHKDWRDKVSEDPYRYVDILHAVLPKAEYDVRDTSGKKLRKKFVSLVIDCENDHLIEETQVDHKVYIIPRWVTVPGSQYAVSPSVVAALPDARLMQEMTMTMLDAAQKFADPPMAATASVVRGDVNLYAGGITWIDYDYDERLGAALRPIYQPTAGQSLAPGLQMSVETREMLRRAFFLDSLSLPPSDVRDMTAFEVSQRISEWIRNAIPIFEPAEYEYNGAVCQNVMELLFSIGAFGPVDDIPESLRGADVDIKFESPLHENSNRRTTQQFLEAKAALLEAAALDPSVVPMFDAKAALRDVLNAVSQPDWVVSELDFDMKVAKAEQERQMAAMMQGAAMGTEASKTISETAKNFADAQQSSLNAPA